jgi:1-acyl-sn-glycerol-3-phosphate acyltransferase
VEADMPPKWESEVNRTIETLQNAQNETGFDPFGFHPESLKTVLPFAHWLYRSYFRVEPIGLENVPEGRALLIANHAGQLPIDGMMIATAMLLDHHPPRMTRAMVEHFIPTVPFVAELFARVGQVTGTRANARLLLERDELLMVFPEGARGISKTYDRRYQLEEFGLGFMRLALETNTPIVPIGVVGSEEQLPSVHNAKRLANVLGMPALPILLSPIPLPVKYRIYFGEPLQFRGDNDDEDRVIQRHVDVVKESISALISRGLSERQNIFTG